MLNGVEARHRDLYRIVQKKKPLMQTLHQIFYYLQSSELDLEFVDAGGRVDYRDTIPIILSIIYNSILKIIIIILFIIIS